MKDEEPPDAPPDWQDWPDAQKARLLWMLQARPKQLPPEGDWLTWVILAGRGWGKTKTGAEWLVNEALERPRSRWAVVAPTTALARDVCLEGATGILQARPMCVKSWNRSMGELILNNGSRIDTYSSEAPRDLRGPGHHGAWCDELAQWENPDETWTQLQLGLRFGERPRVCVTTTPRSIDLVRNLLTRDGTVLTHGATWENEENLPQSQLDELQSVYGGTMIGRQELEGELLEDYGVLWNAPMIDDHRVRNPSPDDMAKIVASCQRIVVAIDPAVSFGEDSDETGIVVVGVTGDDRPHAYVLADLSEKLSAERWAARAVAAAEAWGADRVIAEVNNGGDLVEATLRMASENVPYRAVHASRGKAIRAEPAVALYEQGRVHHVGEFTKLEGQMCTFDPERPRRRGHSPDRMDALVWALFDLILTNRPGFLGSA